MSEVHRVHVIACGVLAVDIRAVAEHLDVEIHTEFLEAGLHERPGELRRRLQEAIDRASPTCDRIAVGYGVCGRGTVGIRARGVPLAIPRAQDCIALFLGSDAAYRREFWRFPGTYYVSAGWYEGKVQPRAQRGARRAVREPRDFEALAAKYGEANARAIVEFLNSWQRNYQRAVFIDTGGGERPRYAAHARAMAEEFGWRYEELPGSLALIEKMLTAERTTDEVLVVPPGYVTVFDPIGGGLKAAPEWDGGQAGESTATETPRPVGADVPAGGHARLGLGIDAGGTYTDVVLYDFASDGVLAKSKALTTRWDYTLGIANALAGLDPALLERVDLVAVSTTLATNAIVEGRGQKVGLLLMPPYGLASLSDVGHEPKSAIAGALEIDGAEIQPVDLAEVRRAARQMVDRQGVGAFAVSGYAGSVNPDHELAVKAALVDETGLSVTCGHELSELLNFRTRAHTAVLNARIIPLLREFLGHVAGALHERGIRGAIMVVKGDGSLMSVATALERPIETILSGPAASVAGARHLTRCASAIVLDMGGTTVDTAAVRDGTVRADLTGARVGGFKTHVRALDMRTTGLGGDSLIRFEKGELAVGPSRVGPVAWLADEQPGTHDALDALEARLDDHDTTTRGLELLALTGRLDGFAPTPDEARVLDALRERPFTALELAEHVGCVHWQLLPLERLLAREIVQRCGLTPTDLLHALGQFLRWDATAASRLCDAVSHVAGLDTGDLIRRVLDDVARRLALEILKKQLDAETDPDVMDTCPACQTLLGNLLGGGQADYSVRVELGRPVIGLGAPVHVFLPRAAELLGAELTIPAHADVANAIGAVTSRVVVAREARIAPNAEGGYAVHGLADAGSFERFDEADRYAAAELERLVRHQARAAGTSESRVELRVDDRIARTADGTEIFLERVVQASLTGQPDIPSGAKP